MKMIRKPILPVTSVGSFPKPETLIAARGQFAKSKLSKEELQKIEDDATVGWMRFQDEIGVDVLVHGEMERGDMVTYFAERMEGFEISQPVRSYGNRYYKKPIVVREVKWKAPMTVEAWKFAQCLTLKPVKGMLTGPYTICDWSFNEFYLDRESLVLSLAEEIHKEVKALDEAGALYIQIDEPALSVRPEEIEIAIEAMGIVTKGIEAYTISHMCYGDFKTIYPRLLDLPVNQLDLEFANGGMQNLEVFRNPEFTKDVAVGVVDVHSHELESVEKIKSNIRQALSVFKLERIWIDCDCGLKTRIVDEAMGKMRNMTQAVREIRLELGYDESGYTKIA